MLDNLLIIFLKFPEPGKVKTRIGKEIGHDKAAKIYKSILKYVVSSLSNSSSYQTTVYYDPKEKEADIKDLLNNNKLNLINQKGITLGERIKNAFYASSMKSIKNVIVIGSDCIEIDKNTVLESFQLLNDGYDVVIGPSTDGGYYLIGLSTFDFDIFDDISWSTDKVFDQTINKIRKQKLKYKILKELNDIDEVQDFNLNLINIVKKDYPKLSFYNNNDQKIL